jgi:hypothetical protein
MIEVSSESEEPARRAIAHIPSEIIFSSTSSASSRSDPATMWLQILAVLFVILLGIYKLGIYKTIFKN